MKNKVIITGITLLILLLIIFQMNSGKLIESKNAPINFYTKGKLMWLIDTTDKKLYYMDTRKQLLQDDPDFVDRSYETRLNEVNTNKKYKYSDWRLPTVDELLTLNQCAWYDIRIFASSDAIKNDTCIDKDIFYDKRSGSFSSTKAGVDEKGRILYYAVGFGSNRYASYGMFENLNRKATPSRSKGSIRKFKKPILYDGPLRLVRDIK